METQEIINKIRALLNELELKQNPENKPVSNIQQPNDSRAKLLELLKSNNWPSAVEDYLLVKTEEDKTERAEGIIDSLLPNINGKKFLDFGCGEGHVVKSSKNTTISVGYDLVSPEEKQNNYVLTSNLDVVKSNGPYDYILLFDVLDHTDNPVAILQQVKELLSQFGTIVVRCHPWCSRHGGHLYKTFNKAYAHLLFNEEELATLTEEKIDSKQKVLFPLRTYNEWFKSAGLNVIFTNTERTNVEDFFKNPPVRQFIMNLFPNNKPNEFPSFQLEQSFLDFTLKL